MLQHLEWVVDDPEDVVVTGMLFRELGQGVDPQIYFDAAGRVTAGPMGPEYDWTRLRAEEFQEHGFFLES